MSAGSMTMSASIISPSSRTSGLVNAACAGPRRPRTTISSIPDSASASIAWSAVSVILELAAGQRQHPGDVGGDVAVADHDGALAGEVELVVGEVGVGVVPGDELGGRVGAGQVLAGDPELAVGRGAVGVDHRVVALGELGDADVAADLDVAEEPEALAGRGLLVDADHLLDLRVVGRDARRGRARTASAGGRTCRPRRSRRRASSRCSAA